MKWDPNEQKWVDEYPEFEQSQRERARGFGIMLPVLFMIVVAVGGTILAVRSVGEESDRRPTAEVSVTEPSPTPTATVGEPSEEAALLSRAVTAFAQLTFEERVGVCRYMTTYPEEAIEQGVNSGLTRKEAKLVVRFTTGELC